MKYLIPYNEAAIDFLKPKSSEQIIKDTKQLSAIKKLEAGKQYNIPKLLQVGKEELLKNTEYLKTLNVENKLGIGRRFDIPELIKIAEDELIDEINSAEPIKKIEKGCHYGFLWAVKDGVKDLPRRNYTFKNFLRTAAQHAYIDVVQYLLNNVKLKSEDIDHALRSLKLIAPQGDKEFIKRINLIHKLLLDKKLQIIDQVKDYDKLLKYGCDNGHYESVKDAIDNGAKINTDYGNYLLNAVRSKNIEIVKLLLDNGINVETISHPSPIQESIRLNNVEITKLLKEHGAKVKYYSMEDEILKWIDDDNHHEIITYLLTIIPHLKQTIQDKINNLNNQVVKYEKYVE